jgi:hypothetical protein
MEIKVCNYGEATKVVITNPATGETVAEQELTGNQEVVITAVNAHDPSDLQVGEVGEAAPPAPEGGTEEPGGEAPPPDGGGEPDPAGGEPGGEEPPAGGTTE